MSIALSQCEKKVTLAEEFILYLPKKYTVIEANDSLKLINDSFHCYITDGKDTVLAFIDDDLYTQAVLYIRQDIQSMDTISAFDTNSNDIQDLKETHDVSFVKKGNKLIVIDFGPKKAKRFRPIELYCRDFSTGKTLVINSSSSLIHWNKNLKAIPPKVTRKISESIR